MPKAKATTNERGYGAKHQATRAEWQRVVDAGAAECWRCGQAIRPGDDWHLGHDDHDRTKYRGPECPSCNTKTGGRNGAAVTNAKVQMVTREW
jgi:hypothetical protein